MRNKWKNAWKELGKNRGSGVVLVLVAISCITLMAVSLLHMSYTAFKMKAAERQGKVDFYMAEAEVDEVLTAVQKEVSNAIAEAQKKTVVYYSSARGVEGTMTVVTEVGGVTGEDAGTATEGSTESGDADPSVSTESNVEEVELQAEVLENKGDFDQNITNVFQRNFFEQIEAWAKKESTEFAERGESQPGISDGYYDLNMLSNLYNGSGNASGSTTISGKSVIGPDGTSCGVMEKNITNGEIILKDVQISHTSTKSDYVTNYEFDIVIHVPDFYYVQEGDTASAANSTDGETSEEGGEGVVPVSPDPGSWKIDDLVTFKNWRTY